MVNALCRWWTRWSCGVRMTYISTHGSANFGCLIRQWFMCGGISRTSQKRISENRSENTHDKTSFQMYKAPQRIVFCKYLRYSCIWYHGTICLDPTYDCYFMNYSRKQARSFLVRIKVVGRASVLDDVILLKYDWLQCLFISFSLVVPFSLYQLEGQSWAI